MREVGSFFLVFEKSASTYINCLRSYELYDIGTCDSKAKEPIVFSHVFGRVVGYPMRGSVTTYGDAITVYLGGPSLVFFYGQVRVTRGLFYRYYGKGDIEALCYLGAYRIRRSFHGVKGPSNLFLGRNRGSIMFLKYILQLFMGGFRVYLRCDWKYTGLVYYAYRGLFLYERNVIRTNGRIVGKSNRA